MLSVHFHLILSKVKEDIFFSHMVSYSYMREGRPSDNFKIRGVTGADGRHLSRRYTGAYVIFDM